MLRNPLFLGIGLFGCPGVIMQVNIFVFHAAPEALDEDIIESPSSTVHADQYLMVLQAPGKVVTGELGPLVGVEHHRLSAAEGLAQGLHTEPRVQRVGQTPGQNLPAVPIDDRHQVQKPPSHGEIRDVTRPYQVGSVNGHVSQ